MRQRRRFGPVGIRRDVIRGASSSTGGGFVDCVGTTISSALTLPPDTATYACGVLIEADAGFTISADNTLTLQGA